MSVARYNSSLSYLDIKLARQVKLIKRGFKFKFERNDRKRKLFESYFIITILIQL